MDSCVRKQAPSQAGFSLIEVAIALLIIGLIFVPMIMIYNNERAQIIRTTNLGRLNTITTAINDFVVVNNRYPMPANLFEAPATMTYGQEYTGPIAGCAGWPTANGVCRTPGVGGQVIIGAVPFAALGINPDIAHDYWGHKILYAVTQSQATAYTTGGGGITARGFIGGYTRSGTFVPRTLVDLTANPHDIVLVSHGETGAGAYSREGILTRPCFDAVLPRVEEENCDMDGTFIVYENREDFTPIAPGGVGGDNILSASLQDTANFYDDYTVQQTAVPADLWLQNTTNRDFALTFAARTGVGTEDPQAKLHVVGDAQATNLETDRICNNAGGNCFSPVIIAGSDPAMDCASGPLGGGGRYQAMVRIENSSVMCGSTVDSSGNPLDGLPMVLPAYFARGVDCYASGMLMTGFDASGVPQCAMP